MGSFVAAIIIMMSLSLATFQVIRNLKYRELAERRHRVGAALLYMESLLVLSDLLAGGTGIGTRLVIDVMLAMIPISVLSSSLWHISKAMKVVYGAGGCVALLTMYNVLCATGLSEMPSIGVYKLCLSLLVVVYVFLFLSGVWMRLREVRAVMQSATVWAGVSFMTETVYVVIVLLELTVLLSYPIWLEREGVLMTLLLAGAMAGYGLRMATDSLFIFMCRQERRIVESMKISPVEVSGIGADDMYKDIYERVVDYFEKDKPFLNGDLTIHDVVTMVYTNKLYVSRAISQNTGRNFCQFVNYYRVMYSIDCFRNNPDLKVAELWAMSGFNTIVSYNMAFKLFMGENPSEWCRKEKIRISREAK